MNLALAFLCGLAARWAFKAAVRHHEDWDMQRQVDREWERRCSEQ